MLEGYHNFQVQIVHHFPARLLQNCVLIGLKTTIDRSSLSSSFITKLCVNRPENYNFVRIDFKRVVAIQL